MAGQKLANWPHSTTLRIFRPKTSLTFWKLSGSNIFVRNESDLLEIPFHIYERGQKFENFENFEKFKNLEWGIHKVGTVTKHRRNTIGRQIPLFDGLPSTGSAELGKKYPGFRPVSFWPVFEPQVAAGRSFWQANSQCRKFVGAARKSGRSSASAFRPARNRRSRTCRTALLDAAAPGAISSGAAQQRKF